MPSEPSSPLPIEGQPFPTQEESLFDGAWRWTRVTSGPILATGAASLTTLVANTLLLRYLPVRDAGLFALALAIVETVSILGAAGQPNLILRLYSASASDANDWLADLLRLMLISTIPVTMGMIAARALYPFSLPNLAWILSATVITIPISLSAYMLNAKLHHTWGTLLLRLPNALLIIPAVIMALKAPARHLDHALNWYVFGLVFSALMTGFLMVRHIPRGHRRIEFRQHLEGLLFLVANGTQLLLDQGMVAIAGAMVQPTAVATFAAFAILLRPFRLLANILGMILTPRFIQFDRDSYTRMLMSVAAIAGAGGVASLFFVPWLAKLIYGGRYAEGYRLVPWLVVAGFLLVFRAVPRSHLFGRAPVDFVRKVIGVEAGVVILVTAAMLLLIQQLGILGLAVGLFLGHAARTLTSFSYWSRFRRIDPFRGRPIVRR